MVSSLRYFPLSYLAKIFPHYFSKSKAGLLETLSYSTLAYSSLLASSKVIGPLFSTTWEIQLFSFLYVKFLRRADILGYLPIKTYMSIEWKISKNRSVVKSHNSESTLSKMVEFFAALSILLWSDWNCYYVNLSSLFSNLSPTFSTNSIKASK